MHLYTNLVYCLNIQIPCGEGNRKSTYYENVSFIQMLFINIKFQLAGEFQKIQIVNRDWLYIYQ